MNLSLHETGCRYRGLFHVFILSALDAQSGAGLRTVSIHC